MLRDCIFHAELSWASFHPFSSIPILIPTRYWASGPGELRQRDTTDLAQASLYVDEHRVLACVIAWAKLETGSAMLEACCRYLHSVRVVGAAGAAGNRSADLANGEPNGEPTLTDTSERPRTLGTPNWLVRNVFYTSVNVYGQLMGP